MGKKMEKKKPGVTHCWFNVGGMSCKSMMCGKRLQSQLWFLAVMFFFPPFYFMYTFFFCPMGGSTCLDCVFFLCTASTLYSDKTPLCSLMETQCWTQNTDRVLLVEANVAVKLPRKPWNVFTSYVAVRITGCFYGRLWTLCGRFKAESYPGGHRYHLWSRLALLCLITIRKVKSPRPCFQKETAKKKSHGGQNFTIKAHCFYSSYFDSPLPATWSCAICDLTSKFSLRCGQGERPSWGVHSSECRIC